MRTLLVLLTFIAAGCFHGGQSLDLKQQPTTQRAAEPVWPPHVAADQQREFEQHVGNLADGAPPEESKAAWEALKTAGMEAIPTLIAHFGDRTVAAPAFQEATSEPTTVGRACFAMVQYQIEGWWPTSAREFHALSRDNTSDWLADHRGLTLKELQQAARRESLARAEAALAAEPSNQFRQRTVQFLTDREPGPRR